MKRTDAIEIIRQELESAILFTKEAVAIRILSRLEKAGMKPSMLRIPTPMGLREVLEVYEWEENAKYDEMGYPIDLEAK